MALVETTFGQTDMIIRLKSVAKLRKPNIHSKTGELSNGVECHSLYRDFVYGSRYIWISQCFDGCGACLSSFAHPANF